MFLRMVDEYGPGTVVFSVCKGVSKQLVSVWMSLNMRQPAVEYTV